MGHILLRLNTDLILRAFYNFFGAVLLKLEVLDEFDTKTVVT